MITSKEMLNFIEYGPLEEDEIALFKEIIGNRIERYHRMLAIANYADSYEDRLKERDAAHWFNRETLRMEKVLEDYENNIQITG